MLRNSTIIPKKKKLKCGCFDYAFSKGRCKMHATIQSTNERYERSGNVELEESRQNVLQDLVAVFSQYIRLKDADSNGINICFTCKLPFHWKQLQNGHYVQRSDMATTFLEDNCHPQCPPCNSIHETNTEPYRKALNEEKIGLAEYLEEQGRTVVKIPTYELKEMLIMYRNKVKILKAKLK